MRGSVSPPSSFCLSFFSLPPPFRTSGPARLGAAGPRQVAPEQGPEGEGEGEGHHEANREEKALARVTIEDAQEKRHARNVDVVSEFFQYGTGREQTVIC